MTTQKLLEITQTNLDYLFNDTNNKNIVTGAKYKEQFGNDETTYDGFAIKKEIIIHLGKTLKDFDNIVVNNTFHIYITNIGTIENCTITLNAINNSYNCAIFNGSSDEKGNYVSSNITNCNITLNGRCWIYNSIGKIGNITGSIITLNGGSWINNGYAKEGNIDACTITLNDNSSINNGFNFKSIINGCNIILNRNSKIYNSYHSEGEISKSIIFIYNNATLQNFYNNTNNTTKYGTLTDNYIFAFDSCKILNIYNSKSGTFNNTHILKYSNNFTYDDTTLSDRIIDDPGMYKLNMSANMMNLIVSTNYLNDQVKKLEKDIGYNENLNSNNEQKVNVNQSLNSNNKNLSDINTNKNNISGNVIVNDNKLNKLLLLSYLTQIDNSNILKNTNGNVTVNDNNLNKLFLLSYLIQKNNSSVLQNLIK